VRRAETRLAAAFFFGRQITVNDPAAAAVALFSPWAKTSSGV
jgi:hypothetical protein